MGLLDVFRSNGHLAVQETGIEPLREQLANADANLGLLRESLAELELAREDAGWLRFMLQGDIEFSRQGLADIIHMSRLMFLKNPLINRGVNIQATYVWGQGVNIHAEDEQVNELVQAFMDDPANKAELTSHQAQTMKEVDLQVLGNLFFVFFLDPTSGATRVRTIPVDEIQEIICNPEDRREPWYYKRVWTEIGVNGAGGQRTAYYPDWKLDTATATPPAGVQIAEQPVYHVRVGGLTDMRFGVPETYQAIDWARAYKSFLEDRATVARALSVFASKLSARGGSRGVAAAKSKLGTTYSSTGGEINPAPVAGSTIIMGEGNDWAPIGVRGATIDPEEGRRFLLMVCAALGLPETFFGDVSTGNLATAKSLDRPTELKFRDRQELWADVLRNILEYVVSKATRRNGVTTGETPKISVEFPNILEGDTGARITSIVTAATLAGKATAGTIDDRTLTRLLLQALGLDNAEDLTDLIAPEGGEGIAAQMRQQKADAVAAIAKATHPPTVPPDQQTPATEAFAEALRDLRAAVGALADDHRA